MIPYSIHKQRVTHGTYFATLIKSNLNVSALLNYKKQAGEKNSKETGLLRRSLQLSVPVFILFNFNALASEEQGFVNAKQAGKDLANSLLSQVQGNIRQDINTKNPITDTSVAESINFKGTDIPEKGYTNENIDNAKNQKAADKNNTEANIVSSSFLRAKEYPISLSSSFLAKANDAQKNPENYVNWLSGKYTDCNQEGGEEVLSKSSHTCNEFKEIKDNTCSVGRSIEVDSKHKYICPRKLNKFEKICHRTLNIAINKDIDCSSIGAVKYSHQEKGIKWPDRWWWNYNIPENGALEASWSYNSPNIVINIYRIGGIRGGQRYGNKVYFQIDLSRLHTFALVSMTYTGIDHITLNGHNIRGAKDLKPILRAGSNVIETQAPISWSLGSNITISATCFKENETWTEQCKGV